MPLLSKPPASKFELGFFDLALLFTFVFAITSQLKRIADSLEKIQPPPPPVENQFKPAFHELKA